MQGHEGRARCPSRSTPARLSAHQAEVRVRRSGRSFEEVRDQIADKRLPPEARGRELAKYLEKLRAQAIIEWKNDGSEEGLRGLPREAGRAAVQLELTRLDLSSR